MSCSRVYQVFAPRINIPRPDVILAVVIVVVLFFREAAEFLLQELITLRFGLVYYTTLYLIFWHLHFQL